MKDTRTYLAAVGLRESLQRHRINLIQYKSEISTIINKH